MRLQLAIQEIPGDHTVLGCRLEEVSGEGTEGLASPYQVPAGPCERVGRPGAPATFSLNCAMSFEQRPCAQAVDSKFVNRQPCLIHHGVDSDILCPKELDDIPKSWRQHIREGHGLFPQGRKRPKTGIRIER